MSFEYEPAYRTHCMLQLDSGRRVVLDSLYQWRTYAGLFDGVPWRELNDEFVERAICRAEELHPNSGRPHAIAPIRTEEQRSGPAPVEWLPHVTCIADFHDLRPARDPNADRSSLVVVWFQPDFGPPEGPVLEELRAIDWKNLASDGWY